MSPTRGRTPVRGFTHVPDKGSDTSPRLHYEGTSIANLTQAMGISPPSLYTAFGDKCQLFLDAIARYTGDPADLERQLDVAPTAREAASAFLHQTAVAFTGVSTPPGCLVASAAASGPEASARVREAVAAVRSTTIGLLRARITRDVDEGRLPATTDAGALAHLVWWP